MPKPPVRISETTTPEQNGVDLMTKDRLGEREGAGLTDPMVELAALDMRFANLEADTWFVQRELAYERTPLFDRRMRSVEHAVYLLAVGLELERW